MKRPFVLLLILLLNATGLLACPHCNIHNYMASSVYAAQNIFKGLVIEGQEKTGSIKVQIVEVYKGRFPVDSIVEILDAGYVKKNDTGIFCEGGRSSFGPSYNQFTANEAGEIRFLLRMDSMARNLHEARICTRGISSESVSGGRKYFRSHYAASFPALCDMLDSAFTFNIPSTNFRYMSWQAKNVVHAYFSDTCKGSKAFVLQLLERYANDTSLQYSTSFRDPGLAAKLICEMIRGSRKYYGNELAEWARKKLATGHFRVSSDMIYALLDSRSNTCEEIVAMVGPGKHEACAYALYYYAQEKYNWWQWKEVEELLVKAKTLATSDDLIKKITELEQRVGHFTGKK